MDDLFARLDALGVAHRTHDHPPVYTVEQSREHWAAIDAEHTKNLLLKDDRGFWLVVTPAEAPLDLKALPAVIGSRRLRFASAEDLDRLLGVRSGSVSAFALLNDAGREVRLVLDASLARATAVAMHPLDNARTTVVAGPDLVRFLESIGVTPIVVGLG